MKTESLEQYLARGGKILKVEAAATTQASRPRHDSVKSLKNGPAILLTMEEADLYYGEQKVKSKDKQIDNLKHVAKLDVSALPEELRKKYCEKVLNDEK